MVLLTKKNGNLIITASNAERHAIKQMQEDDLARAKPRGCVALWYDVMDSPLCNGWDSLEGKLALYDNPYVISEETVEGDSQGGWYCHVGRVYAYMDHVFTDPLDVLKTKGRIVLKGHQPDPEFLYVVRVLDGKGGVYYAKEAATIDEVLDIRDDAEGSGLYNFTIEVIEGDDQYGVDAWREAA